MDKGQILRLTELQNQGPPHSLRVPLCHLGHSCPGRRGESWGNKPKINRVATPLFAICLQFMLEQCDTMWYNGMQWDTMRYNGVQCDTTPPKVSPGQKAEWEMPTSCQTLLNVLASFPSSMSFWHVVRWSGQRTSLNSADLSL